MLRRSFWGFPIGIRRVTKDGRLAIDHHDWDGIFRLFQESDALDGCKKDALDALKYLRLTLGESWADDVSLNHPLLDIFSNPVPWCAWLIIEIADMIRNLRNVPGFETLKQKVKNPQDFEEGLSVAYAATLLRKCGSLKSLWRTENHKDREDLQVEILSLPLLVEITCPKSKLAKKEIKMHEAIMLPVESKMMKLTGQIEKPLSKVRLEEARKFILAAVSKVEKTGRSEEVCMDRAFRLTIHPRSSPTPYRVEGFPFADKDVRRVHEIERIREEIQRKAKQANNCVKGPYLRYANAVIIYSDPWYFLDILNKDNFAEIMVSDLEESVYDCPNLSFFALILIGMEGPRESVKPGKGYLYRAQIKNELISERILVIQNRYAKHQVTDELIDLIK